MLCRTGGVIRVSDDLLYQHLVGVSFYQDALSRCEPGQAVDIIHEPDNPHDPMALRVASITGETIGYLPRRSPVHVATLQHGRGIAAVIDSIGMSRACLLGARLSLALCGGHVAVRSYFADRAPPDPPKGGFRYWVKPPSGAAPLAALQRG